MAILEVRKLYKSFGSNNVLKGIDFDLEEGKVLSIIGSSGSGKTTLLRCITSLETADKGSITVNGKMVFDDENHHKLTKEEQTFRRSCFSGFSPFSAVYRSQKRNPCLRASGKERPSVEAE